MVLSLSVYLRRPHAATSNEPWAVLAFADFPLAPRCPRSFAPLPHSRPAQRSVALPNLPYGPCRPNPPVWPVSALAGPATGCRCISLCSGEQLKTCAGWGVRTSWRTSRPVAILSTHRAEVPCCARVAPCATRSLLSKVPKRSPVPELTQPISGRVELQAVGSGIFRTPCPGLCGPWAFAVGPHLGPHLGPHSGVPGVPQPAALAALHHRVPQGWCWPWLVQAPSGE
jgi:hypothetical protein